MIPPRFYEDDAGYDPWPDDEREDARRDALAEEPELQREVLRDEQGWEIVSGPGRAR